MVPLSNLRVNFDLLSDNWITASFMPCSRHCILGGLACMNILNLCCPGPSRPISEVVIDHALHQALGAEKLCTLFMGDKDFNHFLL